MKNYQKGYVGILSLIIVLALVLFGLYKYADKNPETDKSIKETNDQAMKDAESAVKKIEVRNSVEYAY